MIYHLRIDDQFCAMAKNSKLEQVRTNLWISKIIRLPLYTELDFVRILGTHNYNRWRRCFKVTFGYRHKSDIVVRRFEFEWIHHWYRCGRNSESSKIRGIETVSSSLNSSSISRQARKRIWIHSVSNSRALTLSNAVTASGEWRWWHETKFT